MKSFLPAAAIIILIGLASAQTNSPAPADEQAYAEAWATLALYDAGGVEQIDVTPRPTPDGGKCPDCDGTGRVGDGRIEFKCERCDGTGKLTGIVLPGDENVVCYDYDGDGVCDEKVTVKTVSQTTATEPAPQEYRTVRVRQRVRIACATCPSGWAYSYRWVDKQVPVDGSAVTSGASADCDCENCTCVDCDCGTTAFGSQATTVGETTTASGRAFFNRDERFMQRGPVRRVLSRLPIIRRFCR